MIAAQASANGLTAIPSWKQGPMRQGGPADTTPRVRALVRELGFRGSYIAYQDPARERDLDALPRYGVGTDWTDFRWMLCGAEHLLLRLRRLLGLPVGPGRSYWAGAEPADRAAAMAAATS